MTIPIALLRVYLRRFAAWKSFRDIGPGIRSGDVAIWEDRGLHRHERGPGVYAHGTHTGNSESSFTGLPLRFARLAAAGAARTTQHLSSN